LIFDATHDYRIAFTIFAVASMLAMVTVFFARPPAPLAAPCRPCVKPCPAGSGK
jgi:hypothetical protein